MHAARKTRLGRRTGSGGASKAAIIEAAKKLFAAKGFRGTTTREIAKRAGVDMALVHYFFGTKAKLFAHVIDVPLPAAQMAQLIGQKDDSGAGERLARFYVETMFIENGTQITSMIRAALGDPESIPTLRKLLQEGVVRDAAGLLSGRSAKLRAELVGAIVVGLFVCRHMVQLEPLATAPSKDVVAVIAPALQAVLTGAAQPSRARARTRPRSKDS